MPKNYKMKMKTGYLGMAKPKFVHKFVPNQKIKDFKLNIPIPAKKFLWIFGFLRVRVLDADKVVFELDVVSVKNNIMFNVPKGIELTIGKTYVLEIEAKK